jgi:hypothetical protein
MAFLTGKVNIIGGSIYGTEFCPLYIGKHTNNCINQFSRVSEFYTKQLDLEGTLLVKDLSNATRIELDENNILTFSGYTNIDSLIINNVLTINNADISCLLHENKQFNVSRSNANGDSNYLFNITSENALEVTGKCNINGELYINNELLNSIILNEINMKFDSLSTLKLNKLNDTSGIFINTSSDVNIFTGSGLIWKDDKFNLLQNLTYTDNTTTNLGESNEYAPICVGELTSENHIVNNIYANNVYKTLHEYDLNNVPNDIINIDATLHSISKFTNSLNCNLTIKLLNPTIETYGLTHHLIADHNFSGSIEIEGDYIFPNGEITSTKKIQLNMRGQNVLLTYVSGYWYITNGGINIV